MRPPFRLALLALVLSATPAAAATVSSGQAEAKEAARAGNCTPTKVEVMRYGPGRQNDVVFKINCSENKDAFVLVQCRGRSCILLR